jgi:diguanylate cyclase (GGDEF)-like protein
MKVLYVEDNTIDADLVRRALQRARPPIDIDIATSVREAIAMLQPGHVEQYGWVLFDVNLPDGDGFDVLRYVRDRRLPVVAIALTGAGDEKTVLRALKFGADDYLVKHDDYRERLATILVQTRQRYDNDRWRHDRTLRVLYAEHNDHDGILTNRYINHHAPYMRLEIVTDSNDVLSRLSEDPNGYDVLLLDYRLAGIDALELIKRLRDVLRNDIPVVMVTGRGSEEVAAQALRLGVSDYVIKDAGYIERLPSVLEFANARAQLKRERARVEYLAVHDDLTGLLNRSNLREKAQLALSRSARKSVRCGLLLIDLDDFKHINDTIGHSQGDELLRQIADLLRKLLREGDLCCRLGGDEFAIFMEDIDDVAGIATLAERVLQTLQQGLVVDDHNVRLTVSTGISLFPDDGSDIETLIKNADLAMYRAKAIGRNQFCFFTPSLQADVERRFRTSMELHQALAREEFRLAFQPQWDLKTGAMVGVEALIRWQHPSQGLLLPGAFIPVAEQSGQIIAIGNWVIETACRQLRSWLDAGLSIRVAINISALQFRRAGFLDVLMVALQRYAVPPQLLELELTESVMAEDSDQVESLLRHLRQLDLSMSIDDFGTGYSSLSYLRRMPVKTLKIDRSFVADLPGNADAVAITEGIIAMAHAMGCAVVAEGVEQAAQLEFLRQHGCDYVQGFLMSRPVSADQIPALFAQGMQTTQKYCGAIT